MMTHKSRKFYRFLWLKNEEGGREYFFDFFYPKDTNLFKANNKNTRKRCEIC